MEIYSFLSQYFLTPLGLTGLTALAVILYLYLTKPQPEKKVLPSMKFFEEEIKKTRLEKAFSALKSNIILIINILMVIILSLALAGLYIQSHGSEQTVIVYDNSVSMYEEHDEAVSTILSQASTDNTLIIAGETVEVFEDLNRQEAADLVRDRPPGYHRSNMERVAQYVDGYDGSILLLSNIGDSELKDEFARLNSERDLNQIDYSTENHWGIVRISDESVEVRNYEDEIVHTRLSVNSESREITLEPQETKNVEIELQEGRNIVELPRDGFSPDNTAYVYKPDNQKIGVEYIGPENNYIKTAIESIETAENTEADGDIIILNEKNSEIYSSERSKILMQGSSEHWASESSEKEVELKPPYSLSFKSGVYSVNSSDSQFSSQENALFKNGSRIFYNVEDSKINQEFTYPVLWKDMIEALETPKTFDTSNKDIRLSEYNQTGFQEQKAINYLDLDPKLEFNELSGDVESSSMVPSSQSSVLALILLILLGSETLIMLNRGVYE